MRYITVQASSLCSSTGPAKPLNPLIQKEKIWTHRSKAWPPAAKRPKRCKPKTSCDNIKSALTIKSVKWIDEVLEFALERKPEALPEKAEDVAIPAVNAGEAAGAVKH